MCCDGVGRCDAVLVVILCLVCYQCDNVIVTASAGVMIVGSELLGAGDCWSWRIVCYNADEERSRATCYR